MVVEWDLECKMRSLKDEKNRSKKEFEYLHFCFGEKLEINDKQVVSCF